MSKIAEELLQDEMVKAITEKKDSISYMLTACEIVLYFGFILLVAFGKPFLSSKMGDSAVTIGIPIAVGTIFISWVLTGIYVYWANNHYDKLVNDIKEHISAKLVKKP